MNLAAYFKDFKHVGDSTELWVSIKKMLDNAVDAIHATALLNVKKMQINGLIKKLFCRLCTKKTRQQMNQKYCVTNNLL